MQFVQAQCYDTYQEARGKWTEAWDRHQTLRDELSLYRTIRSNIIRSTSPSAEECEIIAQRIMMAKTRLQAARQEVEIWGWITQELWRLIQCLSNADPDQTTNTHL